MGLGDQRHAPAALHPGKISGVRCTGGWVGLDGFVKSRPLSGFEPRTVRSVASRCSYYAMPGPPSSVLSWENMVKWGKQRTTRCLSLLHAPAGCYGPGLEAVMSWREQWNVLPLQLYSYRCWEQKCSSVSVHQQAGQSGDHATCS